MTGESLDHAADTEPPTFDTGVAHVARVYNYWLGGTANYPADRAAAEQAKRLNQLMSQRVDLRDRAGVTRFFDGLELVHPGVVRLPEWRPDAPGDTATPATMWGGVARKP